MFTTAVPARTDLTPTSSPTSPTGHTSPTSSTRPSEATVRRYGAVLAAGAGAWAVANAVLGFAPDTETGVKVTDLTGLAFQVGAFGWISLQLATRATGDGRGFRGFLRAERALLAVAMVWSVAHALLPGSRDAVWMHVLDAFWPLSMLGMFVVGVRVAVAGRWRGPARWWTAFAQSWVVMCLPLAAVLGAGRGDLVGAAHLAVGYAGLGLAVALRPRLVLGR